MSILNRRIIDKLSLITYFTVSFCLLISDDNHLIEESLKDKWIALKAIILSMLDNQPKVRPTCAVILNENNWQISRDEIKKYGLVHAKIFENEQSNFFKNYFESRIDLFKNSVERV